MKASRFTLGAACAAAVLAVNATAQNAAAPVVFAAPDKTDSVVAYGGIGIFQSGSSYLGTGFVLDGGAVFNVMPQLDIDANFRYFTISKDSWTFNRLTIGGDASYCFMPGEKLNPFAGGGLFFANYKLESESWYGGKSSDSETKIGLKIFGGAEYEVSDELWLRGALVFELISNYNDVAFQFSGGYAVNEQFTPYAKFEYWTDNGDVVFTVGATFKF